MIPKKQIGLQQQVIEIHRSCLSATLLVTLVHLSDQGHPTLHIMLDQLPINLIPLSGDQGVLGVRDSPLHHPDTIGLIVELHLLQDGFQKAFRVGRIINRKVAGKTDLLRFPTQDTGKNRVERAHPKTLSRLRISQHRDTLFHFTCRLIGESQRQDAVRSPTLREQVSDFIG